MEQGRTRLQYRSIRKAFLCGCTSLPDPQFSHAKPSVIALASYPRSGNHLVRFVVEYATGRSTRGGRDTEIDHPIRTNSFPDAADILAHVDPFIFVAQKAHKWKEALAYEHTDGKRFDGFLIVVRNPYEAVAGNVGRRLTEPKPQPPDVEAYIRHQARTWRDLVSMPVRNGRPTTFVWYEDLVSDRCADWSKAVESIVATFGTDVQSERAHTLRVQFPMLREINRAGRGRSWGGSLSVGKSMRFHFDRLQDEVGALVIESVANEIRSLLADCSELALPDVADRVERYETLWRGT